MPKEFSIEKPIQNEASHYHEAILSIINGLEKQVRAVEPDALLHKELHEQRLMDARAEVKEFTEVRGDVCESFGVPNDDEHIYIFNKPSATEQRAFRAFFVLIDAVTKESFYGEGRTNHIMLFTKLCEKLAAVEGSNVTYETVSEDTSVPQRYLTFKGFVSTKEFADLSESNRKMLETPIFDENGTKIETPKTWFVTGHNLPEKMNG